MLYCSVRFYFIHKWFPFCHELEDKESRIIRWSYQWLCACIWVCALWGTYLFLIDGQFNDVLWDWDYQWSINNTVKNKYTCITLIRVMNLLCGLLSALFLQWIWIKWHTYFQTINKFSNLPFIPNVCDLLVYWTAIVCLSLSLTTSILHEQYFSSSCVHVLAYLPLTNMNISLEGSPFWYTTDWDR